MIIDGEKVPAFSATTLSIPEPPEDHLDAIIESSRELYSRPRADVEDDIRETIEASEKYKKELSDSGRLAGEQGTTDDFAPKFVFKSADIPKSKSYNPNRAAEKSAQTEFKSYQKPNKSRTVQDDFRKMKLSPNTMEEKTDRPGLKDLGKLLAEKQQDEPKREPRKKNRHNKHKSSPETKPAEQPQPQPAHDTNGDGVITSADGFVRMDRNHPSGSLPIRH